MNLDELTRKLNEHESIRLTRLDCEKREADLKGEILSALQALEIPGIAGKDAYAQIKPVEKLIVTAWPSVYGFIRDNDAYDLLQRRLTESAVRNRWEDGVEIPGISTIIENQLVISRNQP